MDKEQGKLGKRLEGFGQEPGEGVWNALEAKLAAGRRKRRAPLPWFLLFTAGLLLLGGGIWLALRPENTPNPLVLQSPETRLAGQEKWKSKSGEQGQNIQSQPGSTDTKKQTEDSAVSHKKADGNSHADNRKATENKEFIAYSTAGESPKAGKTKQNKADKGIARIRSSRTLPQGIFSVKGTRQTRNRKGQAEPGKAQAIPENEPNIRLISAGKEQQKNQAELSPAETAQKTELPEKRQEAAGDIGAERVDSAVQNKMQVEADSSTRLVREAKQLHGHSSKDRPDSLMAKASAGWRKELMLSFRVPVSGTLVINPSGSLPGLTSPENGKAYARSMAEANFRIGKEILPWLAIGSQLGVFVQRDVFSFQKNSATENQFIVQGNQLIISKKTDEKDGFDETMRLGTQAGLGLDLKGGRQLPEFRFWTGAYFTVVGKSRYSWAGKVSDSRSGFGFTGWYVQVSACKQFTVGGHRFWVEPQFLYLPDESFRYREGHTRQVNYFGIGLGHRW
jgi:hypothetical protein